jgi:hypothetical protein
MNQRLRSVAKATKNGPVKPRLWWALLRHPGDAPCIFETRALAIANRDRDEYLVRVRVAEAPAPKRRTR